MNNQSVLTNSLISDSILVLIPLLYRINNLTNRDGKLDITILKFWLSEKYLPSAETKTVILIHNNFFFDFDTNLTIE